ncbi:hypothetical protein [Sphingomonas sp.]|uniref:hypothetical protein n=1 Tax=Sphingomonas sp. TaxID=28214 RepID=UPI003D6D4668
MIGLLLAAAVPQNIATPIANGAATAIASPLWNATSLSAVIGAGSALFVMLLKDGFFEWLKTRRARKESDAEIFRRYLSPLAEACEKLVWRNKEIFVDHRHAFLRTATLPRDFNEYKRMSTLYRVASLIGWTRGMDIELSALAAHNPGYTPPIAKQIRAFRDALADGPSVERDRVQQLCRIWSLDTDGKDDMILDRLGMRFEVRAHALFGDEGTSLRDAATLDRDRKFRAVRALADFLAAELGVPPPDNNVVEATLDEAAASLVYREALIYREWQDAIGDAMIDRDRDSPRKFRIIGFAAFSELLEKGEFPWIRVFAASLDDIDFEDPDPRDFRAQQLKRIARAAAAMLIAIQKSGKPSPVPDHALAAAERLFRATD